jgi:hypothetical protein
MTTYTDAYGPNVKKILCEVICVIHGRIPADIRKQLMTAVKAGVFGSASQRGLKT